MTVEFAGPALRLSAGDIDAEASDLGCSPAVIRAVCDVEVGVGGSFLSDGRPTILPEAHVFHRETDGVHGRSNISSPVWDRSLYGPGGAHQYTRLARMIALDRRAALRSTSWGMFQIMGFNHGACGYRDVESFVAAMVTGERAHLDAFTKFCVANSLDDELRATPPNFAAFARGYNGPGYAANAYDTKLAAAWRKWLAKPAANANLAPRTEPDLYYGTLQIGSFGKAVSALQHRLIALGAELVADGDFGPETMAAVVAFQKSSGLVPDGVVGPLTRAAMAA